MKSIVSKVLLSLSGVAMLGGLIFGGLYMNEKKEIVKSADVDLRIQEKYSPKMTVSNNAESESSEELSNLDWSKLKEEYEDIVGWISIPGTAIDYPILQTTDNEFYLNHDYNREPDFLGSIFMDYRQSNDFSEMNTIIYGHNVNVNSPSPKFGELNNYYNEEFFNSHKEVYLFTPNEVRKGEVFAVHADSADSKSNNIDLSTREELNDYIEFMKESSVVDSAITPDEVNQVVTLWSCTMRAITSTNGSYVDENKSRTFLSVAFE